MSEIRDVIIVGSGPAGWTAAIYTARAGLKPLVLAGALDAGGALMTTTEVENFPGFPEGIDGPQLMANMQEQAERFGAEVEYEDATEFKLEGEIKEITTEDGTYRARSVILALGSEYRKLGLEAEQVYSGKGVSWCATCDGFFFKDRPIAVVGGGDSAVTEALFLTKFASKVTVIHRRDELRASKVMADRLLAADGVEMAWNSQVVDIVGGTNGKVTHVILEDTVTGERRQLDIDGLFIAIGHDPRTAVLDGALELHDGYIKVDAPTTRTSLPGVFACGDVVDFRYRQAITAAGTGCAAALDVEAYLDALA